MPNDQAPPSRATLARPLTFRVAAAVLAVLAVLAGCTAPAAGGPGSPGPRETGPSAMATTGHQTEPPSAPSDSGVEGTVTAGPTCPVERPGDSACGPRLIVGVTIAATPLGGGPATRAVTDDRGHYVLRLAPGTYRIDPQAVPGLMHSPPSRPVTVAAGRFGSLDLVYDTGIR